MKKLFIAFLCLVLILLVATSCKDGKITDIFDNDGDTPSSQQEESTTASASGNNGDPSSSGSDSGEESTTTAGESNPQQSGLELGEDTDEGYGPIITP